MRPIHGQMIFIVVFTCLSLALLAPLAFPAVVAVAIVLRHPRGRFPDLPVPVVLALAEDELHTVGVQLLEVGSILQPGLRRPEFSRWRLLSQKS